MKDQFGRTIDYLRISVTDRCNLRCRYCMPEGIDLVPMENLLTLEEIVLAARAAAGLGIRHIKLTGGEPLVRKGLPALVRMLKSTEGIEKVTLTTNGTLLGKLLPELLDAGIDAVNISMDTLDREMYRQITGTDALETVLSSIDAALDAGIPTKVNAVSLDLGEKTVLSLIDLIRERPLDVRFIEMMPIGFGRDFPVVSHKKLLERILELHPDMVEDRSVHGFGPAVYYRIPGYRGSIGLISAIHGKFCSSCNRVRLTSQGYLKTCLCFQNGADLRTIIRSEKSDSEKESLLKETIRRAVFLKPQAHCFEDREKITEAANMNAIGG